MRDTVYVHGLTLEAHIGVTEAERATPQPLRIDIEAACDASVAAAMDDIAGAVDYHAIVQAVRSLVESSRVHLVESLAERIAAKIREDFDVPWVFVKIGKPAILDDTDEVGVAIERGARP